jgi:hypothetical protein
MIAAEAPDNLFKIYRQVHPLFVYREMLVPGHLALTPTLSLKGEGKLQITK